MMNGSTTVVALCALAGSAMAQPINWGNRTGSTISYTAITESSGTDVLVPGVGLFGSPLISGDTLVFNPVAFSSFAQNGASDITDGQLTMFAQSAPGFTIPSFTINEAGDWSLAGAGGAGTAARVNLSVFITVLAVNGVALSPTQRLEANGTFSNGGLWTLASPGPGTAQVWTGGGTFNIDAFLASRGITGSATSIRIALNNTLTTTSQLGTSAFIAKKDFNGVSITVPTPGAAAILGLGVLAAGRRRR
jgi:hypothetical protein